MQHITKLKLAAVHQLCEAQEKSTEYMLQFMQDTCKVTLETILIYLKFPEGEKQKLFKEVNIFTELLVTLYE